MTDNLYKEKITKLINKSKKRGIVKTYTEFCDTDEAKETELAEDEITYYIYKNKGEKN